MRYTFVWAAAAIAEVEIVVAPLRVVNGDYHNRLWLIYYISVIML